MLIDEMAAELWEQEFDEALVYALHKHRNNPLIHEDWYLAQVIAETIRQHRFSLWTFQNYQKRKEESRCRGFAANAVGS